MRGSGPSIGAFSSFAQQFPSRIPHLKLHILVRRSPSKSAQVPERPLPVQRRCLHAISPSFAPSDNFFRDNEHAAQAQIPTASAASTAPTSESQDGGACETLDEILQQAHPERVLWALLSTGEGRRFIVQAPADSFAAAFCSIDPWYLIEPFKDVYRYMKPTLAKEPKYRRVRAIEERLDSFAAQLEAIVRSRRSVHQLTKNVCSHLLHCARVLGHGPMASHIWHTMIPEDGLQHILDEHDYNSYMEAICWSNAFSKIEQWRLRVTPRILGIRSCGNPPPDLSGHRTGFLGIRHQTLVLFRSMVSRELNGNEETFTNLMIAMGREGDIAGAKSILKSVYNIDVDLLLKVDEEEVETPTFYEAHSPLRPTARLLYTITHVFGSNNDIRLAFKLVDFVSRQYDLRIPPNVWMHLFDWALVLSLRRTSAKQGQGQAIGRVSHNVIDTLWNEVTDEPHNIKPDIVMHLYWARSQRGRDMFLESLQNIRLAKTLFDDSKGEAERLREDLLAFSDQILARRVEFRQQVVPAEWFDLRRRFILSSLNKDRDLQLLIVAIRSTLQEGRSPDRRKDYDWERRELPDLMAEFVEYLPNTLVYETSGGHIEMMLKWDRMEAARSDVTMFAKNGLMRECMDRNIATMEDLFAAQHTYRVKLAELNDPLNQPGWTAS